MIVNPAITTLKYKAKEENIDIDKLMEFHLCLLLAESELSIVVTHSSSGKCLLAEKYAFETTKNTNSLLNSLEEIYEDHHLLKAGFWGKITVAICNQNFTLIPNGLFESENAQKYLELHNEVAANDVIKTFNHKSIGATSIFSVKEDIVNWFKKTYPVKETKFIHQSSPFIEGVIRYSNSSSEKEMFINCEGNTLTIAVLKNGELEYCNNFIYNTPQDVVYFTLFVINELYLNTEKIPVTLWGDLNMNTPVFVQLFKYIRKIEFGQKPKNLTFSYMFDDLEDNQLFNTYNIASCE